jgi:dsDNA-specific endonuclease/ATPase MutS2
MKRKPPLLDPPYTKKRALSTDETLLWQRTISGEQITKIPEKEKPSISSPISLEKPSRAKSLPANPVITTTLDLHGFTLHAAYKAVLTFVSALFAQKITSALIITGKGTGENTLRAQLPQWLETPALSKYIASYRPASPRQGGSGAWQIKLKKKIL